MNFSPLGSAISGQTQQTTNKVFAVERMIAILVNNLHKVELIWEQVINHLLELAEHGSPQVWNNGDEEGETTPYFSQFRFLEWIGA